MKINLVLEVGMETAVVISALEGQANLFRETSKEGSHLRIYADISDRLATKVLVLTELATIAKVNA